MKCLVHICIILSIGSAGLSGQNEPIKPHSRQVAQYGHINVDQQGDFTGYPQDLIVRDGLREPSHVVFGYHPYWNGTAWQNYEYNMLSHIAWFGLAMSSNGSITNSHSWPITGLVDLAHSHGVKVIVTVTQFDNSAIATLVGNAGFRQTAIDNLIDAVSLGNADGVNIDFEFVPTSARNNFNTFIHDLTVAFHDQLPGSEVSIAMPSVDWWNSYDYDYLSDNSDGLMIMAYGYYWSGSANAGPLSPLNSGLSSWYIRRTIEDYLTKTGDDGSQLILGLPWYGRDWPVSSTAMGAPTTGSGSSILYPSAEANAQSYGKHYNADAPSAWYNYNSGGMRQVWYDDSLSLATKYSYAKDVEIKGIGIWALGYDGGRTEIWGGLSDAFGATAPPIGSQYFTVRNVGDGTVAVHCAASMHTDQYEAYVSTDGSNFSLAQASTAQDFLLEDLEAGQLVYVKIRNTNIYGNSNYSEVLGVVVSNTTTSSVLVVQGFERTSGTVNSLDYIIEHGSAIFNNGRYFDAASNDAVETGAISLTDYDLVDWISGEEATATVSFSPTEQSRIRDYLEQGGRLFSSGSEIGYDLEANGSDSDISFYHNYLKADYIVDNTQSYSTSGPANGIFSGLSDVAFDDGSHGTYDVDFPDGIKPFGGSVNNLRYAGSDYAAQGGAGIQYLGNFGESTALGAVVYLGFGFETIYPEATRNIIMGRVLDFLEISVDIAPTITAPQSFQVSQVFPNPFNGSFSFSVNSTEPTEASISLFNLRGQLIQHFSHHLQVGENQLSVQTLDQPMLSSGIYVLQVTCSNEIHSQNITYLK